MKDTEYWILKYKSAHWTDVDIAKKLATTPEEVKRMWDTMLENAKSGASNGTLALSQQYAVLSHQYQLLGLSLKVVANALANEASHEEILALLDDDKKISAERLRSRLIVLRPFQFQDPEKALQDSLRRQARNT